MVNENFAKFREDALKTETTEDLINLVQTHLNENVIRNKKIYPKVKEAWKNEKLKITPGNEKLDEGIGIENMSSAHNCYSRKNGYCAGCQKCYAKSQENMYAGVLMYNTINQVLYRILPRTEFKSQFKEFYEEHDDLEFHRWNSFGEFESLKAFKTCDDVSKMLLKEFDVHSYSYTHNIELPVETLAKSNIVINFSYDVGDKYKKCIVSPGPNLRDYYNKPGYVICLGKCGRCAYCKDPNSKATVVFVQHGNGVSTEKQIIKYFTPREIRLMEIQRDEANLKFQKSLIL